MSGGGARRLNEIYKSGLPATKKLETVITARNAELRACKRKLVAQKKQIAKLLELLSKDKP